jgi:hypothetical protein
VPVLAVQLDSKGNWSWPNVCIADLVVSWPSSHSEVIGSRPTGLGRRVLHACWHFYKLSEPGRASLVDHWMVMMKEFVSIMPRGLIGRS